MKIRQRLRERFMLSLLLMMLLLLAIILLSYASAASNLRRQLEQNAQDALHDTATRAEDMIESAVSVGGTAAGFSEVYNFMAGTPVERLEMRDTVRYMLRSYVELKKGLCVMYVYMADGACLTVRGEMISEQEYLKCMTIKQDVVRGRALKTPYHSPRITQCYAFGEDVYYAVLTPVYPSSFTEQSGAYMGTLIFIYNAAELAQSLPESGSVEMLLADDERMIACTSEAMERMWMAGERETMLSSVIDKTGWTVWAASTTRQVGERMARFRSLCVIMALATAAVFIVLTLLQYKSIVSPILTISGQTEELGTDENALLTASFGVDELDHLVESINEMLISQRETSREMMRIKVKYYEEQLVFLQSQINPHFLYNSFECIRGMASAGSTDMVRELASSMAAIYRYCSTGTALAALGEEKECIIKYARIISMCYRNLYCVKLDIPDDTLTEQVPRMILQPLVENAVMHGFAQGNRKSGCVQVCVRKENGALVLRVTDDGMGMTDEEMSLWNDVGARRRTPPEGHIGIGNVARRLDLIYGDGACMRFSRVPEGGLFILIRLERPEYASDADADMA